jgi:hypothetical protein
VIDLDSFVGEVHGYAKQGAGVAYTGERGYHPLLATRSGSGEVLHVRQRKGRAASGRLSDFLCVRAVGLRSGS